MAFNPVFSFSQVLGLNNLLNVIDESTGTDLNIVSRKVSALTAMGTYLVPAGNSDPQYIAWALANASISLDILNQDYALSVKVDWLDSGGGVLYTLTQKTDTTQYLEEAAFNLVESESADQSVLLDNNYLMNALRLRFNIDNANRAITMWDNITVSQNCLNRGTYLVANQAKFF